MRTLSAERRTQGLLSAWRCLRDCVPPLFVIMITVLFFLFLLFLTFFLLLERREFDIISSLEPNVCEVWRLA